MHGKNWIFIWGMPGSGKSTVGRKLASMLEMTWKDLDQIIETGEGKKISAIFEQSGENGFRVIEKNYLQNHHFPQKMVLSCGGGTPAFFDNAAYMKANGTCIYLKAAPSFLLSRLKNGNQNRPMLKQKDETELLTILEELLSERKTKFETADITVNIPTQEAEKQILKLLQEKEKIKKN